MLPIAISLCQRAERTLRRRSSRIVSARIVSVSSSWQRDADMLMQSLIYAGNGLKIDNRATERQVADY